jgi:hypothetical protein
MALMQSILTKYPTIALLGLGALLAAACAYLGSLLTPIALARWTIQINDGDAFRAMLAMVGARHLPLFLLAVWVGNITFRLVRSTTPKAAAVAMLPYLVYVLVSAVSESLDAGEGAWSWVVYEPSYFIWPHFVAVPAGLFAARHMVQHRA